MELKCALYSARISLIDAPGAQAACADLLQPEEHEQMAGMRSDKRRREFLVGRALARTALGAWSGASPWSWRIHKEPSGRPWAAADGVADAPAISLTHSGDRAICALTHRASIGVDIEWVRPRDIGSLAAAVCAASERAWLDSVEGAERLQRFYQLWTLKEAVSKALGKGLAARLRELRFEPRGGGFVQIAGAGEGQARCYSFAPAADTVGALAILAPGEFRPRIGAWIMTAPGHLETDRLDLAG